MDEKLRRAIEAHSECTRTYLAKIRDDAALLRACWAAFGDVLGNNRAGGAPVVNIDHLAALQDKCIAAARWEG